jgi:hypothetical protein
MTVLQCVKPGVKPGQVILAVDLTTAGLADEVLIKIEALGYKPEIRHVAYPSGVHVLAILKDEQHEIVGDDYLIDEWLRLVAAINSDSSVHLWRGKTREQSASAAA